MQKYVLSSQISNIWLKIISIDSLKIRIPLSEVELIGDNLGKIHTVVNVETGESFDEFKRNSEKYNYKGVSVHWRLEDQYDKGIVIPYLVILVNSKIFRDLRYFHGITKDNSKSVYDNIIELGIAKFTYDSFLKAQCTDVDFKKDFYCKIFKEVISHLQNISKSYKLSRKGINPFKGKGNKGVEYGSRKTATPAYPYLKFYHKFLELVTNSTEFYNEYIKPLKWDIDNLVRVEFTIKNKKHFAKYKIENTSLENILNLEQSTLEDIMKDVLSVHLDQRVNVVLPKAKLNTMDILLLNFVTFCLKNGMSYNQICENYIVGTSKDPNKDKLRIRNKLDEIYKTEIKGSLEDNKSIEVDSFFNALGWS